MTGACGRSVLLSGGLLLAALTMPWAAEARPLKKEQCQTLSAERGQLAKQGVEKAIVKGPDWTRANMPAATIERVRRYLEIEEQLRFRCAGFKPPELAPEQTAAVASDPEKPAKPQKAAPAPKKAGRAGPAVKTGKGPAVKTDKGAAVEIDEGASVKTDKPKSAEAPKTPQAAPRAAVDAQPAAGRDADMTAQPLPEDTAAALAAKGETVSAKDETKPGQAALADMLVPAPERKPENVKRIVRKRRVTKKPPVLQASPIQTIPGSAGD